MGHWSYCQWGNWCKDRLNKGGNSDKESQPERAKHKRVEIDKRISVSVEREVRKNAGRTGPFPQNRNLVKIL